MNNGFKDRIVVVTGGTGALGKEVVRLLLRQGAVCHVPFLAGEGLLDGIEQPNLRLTRVDLRSDEAVSGYFESLPGLWASIHLAGGYKSGPLVEASLADFDGMFDLNTRTTFLCVREAVRTMRRQDPVEGRIVNVAARPALVPVGGMVPYSMSKAGVVSLTQSAAEELRQEGILVNAVAPSIMDTPASRQSMPGADYSTWPKTEDVAREILFLASPENQLTTGAVLPVYGRA